MKKAIYGSALLALMVAGVVHAQTGFGWNDGDFIVLHRTPPAMSCSSTTRTER